MIADAGLKVGLTIALGLAVAAFGAWGYRSIQRSNDGAYELEIANLRGTIETAGKEARERFEKSKADAKAEQEEKQRDWQMEIQRLTDQANDRARVHDDLVSRMRDAVAAREGRRPVCRPSVPEAGRDPRGQSAGTVPAGRDRAGSDDIPDRAATFIERAQAVNEAYVSLVAKIRAGNCPTLKE
jgi:hypothetical protein